MAEDELVLLNPISEVDKGELLSKLDDLLTRIKRRHEIVIVKKGRLNHSVLAHGAIVQVLLGHLGLSSKVIEPIDLVDFKITLDQQLRRAHVDRQWIGIVNGDSVAAVLFPHFQYTEGMLRWQAHVKQVCESSDTSGAKSTEEVRRMLKERKRGKDE